MDGTELLAWAGERQCLICDLPGRMHRQGRMHGDRGDRIALVRGGLNGEPMHEFDPGERRHEPRSE